MYFNFQRANNICAEQTVCHDVPARSAIRLIRIQQSQVISPRGQTMEIVDCMYS